MNVFETWLQTTFGLDAAFQRLLVESVLVIAVLWLTRRLVLILVWRKHDDVAIRYRWRNGSQYIATGIGVIIVGSLWFRGFRDVTTFLGIVSAGVAIALKDIISNLAGWAFIIWRRPFVVGDRIEINGLRGDVIDIRIFQFTLLEIGNWVQADQSTGRIMHIPNGMVLTVPTANYNRGFQYIWHELPVLLTFESDWEKAKSLLSDIVKKHGQAFTIEAAKQIRDAAEKYLIFYTNLTPTVYTNVEDSGVLLTMRFLCDPKHRRAVSEAIWEDVLHAFAQHDNIDFAYPTQRFYNNAIEGKAGARAEGIGPTR